MSGLLNSLIFLKIGRDTLCELIDDKDFKYFIQTEASDYQIMNILVHNTIPEEKYNEIKENQLWEQFQELICENWDDTEIHKIVLEMGPIYKHGLSSSKPILEFLNEIGDQQKYIQGLYSSLKKSASLARQNIEKGSKAIARTAAETAKKGALGKVAVGMTAGAAASVIAYAAYKLYQNHLTKAGRACKGKPDKTACMRAYKDRAMQIRIEKLKSGLASCTKAKNKENCQKSIQSKITKLQTRKDKNKV